MTLSRKLLLDAFGDRSCAGLWRAPVLPMFNQGDFPMYFVLYETTHFPGRPELYTCMYCALLFVVYRYDFV